LAAELLDGGAARYAAAFAGALLEAKWGSTDVLVGRDLRPSSPQIARTVIEVIAGAGLTAVDCGEVPTPALALAALQRQAPAIMVTGSHIPADRNGLKFYLASGEIEKADEAAIVAALDRRLPAATGRVVVADALSAYRERYAALLPKAGLAGRRIGVWQHSSVARDLLMEVLAGFGAIVVPLGRSQSFVPVDTEAVSAETAAEVAAWVRAERLEALVSTDGDADRPLVADETGAILRGDVIGILTARFLGADTAVTPVTSNSAIEATGFFDSVVRTKVGSPFVIAGMAKAAGRVVGFEANGGVLLGSDVTLNSAMLTALPTRDALLPILAVLAAAGHAPLSQLVAALPPRFARSDRLEHVPPERSAKLLQRLSDDAAGFLAAQGTIKASSEIDGLRFELTSGDIIHYRPSGNAPELRCYTEAATPARADALLAWGLAAAKAVVG
jgi:phosphomannomutase